MNGYRGRPAYLAKSTYIYNFGDYWEHEVTVERILSSDEELRYPVCIEGKRACPPEDCGGIWGYSNPLRIIRNPAHEGHKGMMEWLGGEFDPERFDIDEVGRWLVLPTLDRHRAFYVYHVS